MTIVYIFRADLRLWCVLRAAHPGGRITTLCVAAFEYRPVHVSTEPPHNACPACATELAAGTPGAAIATEPADPMALAIGRATTTDLRRPVNDWDPPTPTRRDEASADSDDLRLPVETAFDRLEEP